ncbi:MAG: DUF1957 domain-containing protein [Acidobacteria bacterium]|nr:DUF1957 domain-containing protein [Acidobacteriota bacterium]
MDEITGRFLFVLHSHIPYVMNHGVWPHGEHWLFEAAAETYLPLLKTLRRFESEKQRPAISIGMTPVLVEQMKSDGFRERFSEFLNEKLNLAIKDVTLLEESGDSRMAALAGRWRDFYRDSIDTFQNFCGGDIVDAFRKLQDEGLVEILTSAATHGYLPLLSRDACVRAQIKAGIQVYENAFGRKPEGIWMPECAYRPAGEWVNPIVPEERFVRKGVDEILVEEGLEYTVIDSPLLGNANLLGMYSEKEPDFSKIHFSRTPYLPYRLSSGLQLFVRDHVTGYQVWSRHHGYPGDPYYLEFHKMKDTSGIKFWRITGTDVDLGGKQPYDPEIAEARIKENSAHFVGLINRLMAEFKETNGCPGVLVAPFDAELFGHWWFEGPRWLYEVLHLLKSTDSVVPVTCREMAEVSETAEVIDLPEGSWGENADHSVWLNDETKWTFRELYSVERNFVSFVQQNRGKWQKNSTLKSVLTEAAKSLLLAEASDWQFLIHKESALDYVEKRFRGHVGEVARFLGMANILNGRERLTADDEKFLERCHMKNDCFQSLDLTWWCEDV